MDGTQGKQYGHILDRTCLQVFREVSDDQVGSLEPVPGDDELAR